MIGGRVEEMRKVSECVRKIQDRPEGSDVTSGTAAAVESAIDCRAVREKVVVGSLSVSSDRADQHS